MTGGRIGPCLLHFQDKWLAVMAGTLKNFSLGCHRVTYEELTEIYRFLSLICDRRTVTFSPRARDVANLRNLGGPMCRFLF